jgi:two-component system LytT family response regulator
MKTFTAIIVDDEAHCLRTLQAQILWTELPIRVINTFDNVCDAQRFLKNSTPDFIFLDVKMPVSDGFSLFSCVNTDYSDVIFTTAHDEFALKAFEHHASGYLLKPISLKELKPLLKSLISKREVRHYEVPKELEVVTSSRVYKIPHHQILYAVSKGSYSTIKLEGGEEIKVSIHLKKLAERLEDESFFRIHHQYLVNSKKVQFVNRLTATVELHNGETLPVSRSKKAAFVTFFSASKAFQLE